MFEKKEKPPVPVLYTTTARGSLFRSGSVNPTLYFHIEPDAQLYAQDPEYKAYYEDMMSGEVFMAIVNKFIVSQPLKVTNDKVPFVMFKSNIDEYSLKEFCKAIVQEFSFHTGKEHEARYGFLKTMFLEIGKEPRFSMTPKGEKITRMENFDAIWKPLEYDRNLADQGIMVPFSIWKEEKRREREKEAQEQEETVAW